MGGIFILKRNLIISVVLSVAWIFATVFAFVTINNHNKMIRDLQYIEVAKVEDFVEIINEEINALKYNAQKVSTPVNFSGFGSLKAIVPKIVDNKRKISASAKAKMQTEIR